VELAVTEAGKPESLPVRLSVVIPNYNHGALIGKAIRAFAEQDPAPDEIIVVDDGSTDDSLARLEQLARVYPSLRVASLGKNQGAVAALNHGLRAAHGVYVNFGAADDQTHPGLFAATLGALQRHPSAAFACTEGLIVEVEGTRGPEYRPPVLPSFEEAFFPPAQVSELLRRTDNWILVGTAVVRRDVIVEAGGFDPALRSFTDGLLFRQLALRHGFCFVPHVGMTWHVSPSGYSRLEATDISRSFEVMRQAIERMRSDPAFPVWYPEVFERRWRFALGRFAIAARPMRKATMLQLSRGRLGHSVLSFAALIGGSVGRGMALAWFVLQERPMSLLGIARTTLFRAQRNRRGDHQG
jgi:glycosyltransferase involved in cell wall biosynthesis